jgi:urease accessory protein
MARDAAKMRDQGPTVFTAVKHGQGVQEVIDLIIAAWKESGAAGAKSKEKQTA